MTKCVFCGNDGANTGVPDLLHDDGLSTHDACSREWTRRFDDDLCTVCGDGLESDNNIQWCNICNETSQYTGYPGGFT